MIESLLISIKDQNYNQELLETYVIVESEDDPTCEIAKKYDVCAMPKEGIFATVKKGGKIFPGDEITVTN